MTPLCVALRSKMNPQFGKRKDHSFEASFEKRLGTVCTTADLWTFVGHLQSFVRADGMKKHQMFFAGSSAISHEDRIYWRPSGSAQSSFGFLLNANYSVAIITITTQATNSFLNHMSWALGVIFCHVRPHLFEKFWIQGLHGTDSRGKYCSGLFGTKIGKGGIKTSYSQIL